LGNVRIVYAHTLAGHPPSAWEPLDAHAAAVARLARAFAAAFGAGDWGELLGRWHDLGKASAAFQAYIRSSGDPDAAENEHAPGRVDHSTFGARHASRSVPGLAGQLLAFCIAGHHGRLPDATTADEEARRSTLAHRLDERANPIPPVTLQADFPGPPALQFPFTQAPFRPPADAGEVGFAVAFFARMLFSALVDADRTATEAFCDKAAAAERGRPKPTLDDLRPAVDAYLRQKQSAAPPTPVNQIRARVLAACVEKSALSPGFFSLNVPTGGGKTFASLAFALHHAHHHHDRGLRRVVVAIPFTSIIEQTADAYREGARPARGPRPGRAPQQPKPSPRHAGQQAGGRELGRPARGHDERAALREPVRRQDDPVPQAPPPGRQRHHPDEAQSVPVDLLAPTLAALRELVARYGCSVVLCTATQPALEHRPGEFEIGLAGVRPIIDDAPALHGELKRVSVERPGTLNDDQLVGRLAAERAALCVVNTRPHAAKLYDALVASRGSATGCYHLSTFMCAQHRRDVLARVRQRLAEGKPCRLISTQLIEAGVDVDFPVVYRAPAGFDSIAQAAGRCNREGKLTLEDGRPALGRVVVFDTESPPPPGMLRQTAQAAKELFDAHPDPLAPSAVEAYFRLFYWSRQHEWDKHAVMPHFGYPDGRGLPPFMFRQAADAYRIIREEQTPILVPYNAEARAMRDRLRCDGAIDFGLLRAAQRYTVGVRGARRETGGSTRGAPWPNWSSRPRFANTRAACTCSRTTWRTPATKGCRSIKAALTRMRS
jgi:CRISPR-associated endonuclease/helicase Cas3